MATSEHNQHIVVLTGEAIAIHRAAVVGFPNPKGVSSYVQCVDRLRPQYPSRALTPVDSIKLDVAGRHFPALVGKRADGTVRDRATFYWNAEGETVDGIRAIARNARAAGIEIAASAKTFTQMVDIAVKWGAIPERSTKNQVAKTSGGRPPSMQPVNPSLRIMVNDYTR